MLHPLDLSERGTLDLRPHLGDDGFREGARLVLDPRVWSSRLFVEIDQRFAQPPLQQGRVLDPRCAALACGIPGVMLIGPSSKR